MQIVIDIPEDEYRWIRQSDNTAIAALCSKECMLHAIKNGTPLPKGHGNLVDRDAINHRFYNIWKELKSYSNQPHWKDLLDNWSMCMDTAPIIIKANEEEEDETNY